MDLIQDRFGSLVVEEHPSHDALNQYYRDTYYEGGHTNYPGKYSVDEINYFHFKDKILEHLLITRFGTSVGKLLDIGCGEGFTLDYFHSRGWECFGADFSIQGIKNQNAHLAGNIQFEQTNIVTGSYFDGELFDVIVGNGILEHVTDKIHVVSGMYQRLKAGGYLFVLVPNDFGLIQRQYLNDNKVETADAPWVVPMEHLTYFSADSLRKTVESVGFRMETMLADFPIEMFLLNRETNCYETDFGKIAHQLRVKFTNLIASDIGNAVQYCESMANVGVGRCLMGLFRRL
ncbi:class I SAM-dependent methyltransferase [Gammaproteobacteria bacterium]|nr:class I SAM-dependent methyltransferase [Gammaproteobacteria bacterium]